MAQTLYSSVTERIREFATLKAMGADDQCVGRFLIAQALGTAVIGSALGLLGSLALSRGLSSPRSPVVLTWQVAVLSVALIVLSCLLAACLPNWRIRRIDPANLFAELRVHALH